MNPLDLLLSALAFLAGALGLWLIVCFVVAAVVLFKPRGKSFKTRPAIDFADQAMQKAHRDAVEAVRGDG